MAGRGRLGLAAAGGRARAPVDGGPGGRRARDGPAAAGGRGAPYGRDAGRIPVRLDRRAAGARLNACCQEAGCRIAGRKEGKPQPGGVPRPFTLREKRGP
ncbi:hypothetical protein [Streptomyces sp. NPDC057382]|uniref:hypothetical protein n=1 Tax=unclassified Streptomyces TaxID=2593676 RepID=UPI0036283DB7